jgi:putative oxygen-independent coproporphyrinogen III oxidase
VIGLYLHVPFCAVRCAYCDFYLVTGRAAEVAPFVAALGAEIEATPQRWKGLGVDTIHFGGGTPSRLSAPQLASILGALRASFEVAVDAEVGLEANPEDLEPQWIEAAVEAGFTRLSIGVQCLDDALLRRLRRPHDAARALRAVDAARRSGLRNVGVDLLLGLPRSSAETLADVARCADRGVDHVSLYLLELHPRTRLGREAGLGRWSLPDGDRVADLYEAADDLLVARGFEHYEISNYALPGCRSRHNLKYWTDGDYLGFGPAAHSYMETRRWSNAADLAGYLAAGGSRIRHLEDPQPPSMRGFEALITGLRLAEGIDLERLRGRYGDALPSAGAPVIAELRAAGWVRLEGARLTLTRAGRLVSNEIFERLMPAPVPPRGRVN